MTSQASISPLSNSTIQTDPEHIGSSLADTASGLVSPRRELQLSQRAQKDVGRFATGKFAERAEGVGRGKSRRAGRERIVVLGGKQGAKGGGVRVGEREDVGVGPAKTRYAKQAANLNGPAQNEWPHLVLRSLVSSVPFPRARVAVSGCDSPTHTQLCTRQRAKGGVGRGEGKVRGGGREGEKEREREKKRHEERIGQRRRE